MDPALRNRDIPDVCLQHMVAVMLIDTLLAIETVKDIRTLRPLLQRS